ncbi:hypothetical protein D3C86_465130 [compost metagenome]
MAVTSSSASPIVTSTELIDVVMNGVVSNGTVQPTPAGNTDSSSLIRCLTCCATSSALASLASCMAMPAASLPLTLSRKL